MIFELTGDVPSKKNSKRIFTRGSRPVLLPSENHEAWHEDASWQLKVQTRPADPIKKAAVVITIWPSTARKADLTNKAESIMDLLVDMEILEDDNWFVVGDNRLIFGGVDKENPRAKVEITVL